MRHIDVTRYLHLFTIFDIQFSVTPLFLSRTRRPTHNSLRALTVRRCHRHGLRHDDFDLWILSGVWYGATLIIEKGYTGAQLINAIFAVLTHSL